MRAGSSQLDERYIMSAMVRVAITDELLDQMQAWATHRLTADEYRQIFGLIAEIRRLKKRIDRSTERREQCAFTRTIGGQQFRCTATAKYGSFCGHHKPKTLRQRPKGCIARNRTGVACKAVVLSDDLCPTHWQRVFGHDYKRDGTGFRCSLCGAPFDYWLVEGKGRDRTGSIKRVARCPMKAKS
jgi:hypothetical protein